jgi:hypothetical protein
MEGICIVTSNFPAFMWLSLSFGIVIVAKGKESREVCIVHTLGVDLN